MAYGSHLIASERLQKQASRHKNSSEERKMAQQHLLNETQLEKPVGDRPRAGKGHHPGLISAKRTWCGFRGTLHIEHTLARVGAERLWHMLHEEPYIAALGRA